MKERVGERETEREKKEGKLPITNICLFSSLLCRTVTLKFKPALIPPEEFCALAFCGFL